MATTLTSYNIPEVLGLVALVLFFLSGLCFMFCICAYALYCFLHSLFGLVKVLIMTPKHKIK